MDFPVSSKPLEFFNVFDISLTEDNIRHVAMILLQASEAPDVEIEAKLGKILVGDGERLKFPLISTCLLPIDSGSVSGNYRFQAALDEPLFRHLNERLLKPRYGNSSILPRLSYSHPILIDNFYEIAGERVRVSTDKASGKILAAVIKKPLIKQDFLYCSPHGRSLDIRISANREISAPAPSDAATPVTRREKNRLSYKFSIWSIDLTRVSTWTRFQGPEPVGEPQIAYEVEFELLDNALLRREALKHRQGAPSQLLEIAKNLLENIKTLAKFSNPAEIPPPACRRENEVKTPAPADSRKRPRENEEQTENPPE